MAEKPVIRLGDPTSHGGTVIEAFPTLNVFGKPAAGIGHKVTCPKCKGVFPIIAGAKNYEFMGKNVALEGMKTACGAALIATQKQVMVDVQSGSAASPVGSRSAAAASTASALASAVKDNPVLSFNDKYQLLDAVTNRPLMHHCYAIERANGDIEHGETDKDGNTHLLSEIAKAETIQIYLEG